MNGASEDADQWHYHQAQAPIRAPKMKITSTVRLSRLQADSFANAIETVSSYVGQLSSGLGDCASIWEERRCAEKYSVTRSRANPTENRGFDFLSGITDSFFPERPLLVICEITMTLSRGFRPPINPVPWTGLRKV